MNENTPISLKNAVAAVLMLGGLIYGYQVTIGGIEARMAVLEQENRNKDAKLREMSGQLSDMNDKIDKLIDLALREKSK